MLSLSIKDTNALKGIALCMLLVHHLFYIQNGMYNDVYFKGVGIVQAFAVACKACVPLFVFLSGYGLMAVCEGKDEINWIKFFKRRFKKLFYNYWLIWIIFVPLGVIFFDQGFDKVYLHNLYWELPLDLMGLSNLIGLYGYNPTWWFYSCIIVLYLFFPFIFYTLRKGSWYGIAALLVVSLLLPFSSIKFFQTFKYYLLPFLLGALCRSYLGNKKAISVLSIWGGGKNGICISANSYCDAICNCVL